MIELAPNHKYGLSIAAPVMPASGTFGYGEAYHDLVDLSLLGAIVTNPVSLRPRRAAHGQRIGVHADHFVVHTGGPSPGLRRVIREAGPVWERLPVPVIVHLLATRPVEVGRAAAYLSGVRGVRGLELGFTENISFADARDLLAATAEEGDLPVIVKIPFSRVDDLAPRLAQAGADAVTLMSPPRAVLPVTGGEAGDDVAMVGVGYGDGYGDGEGTEFIVDVCIGVESGVSVGEDIDAGVGVGVGVGVVPILHVPSQIKTSAILKL